ncbi:hypothetical protein CBR_g34191 [Chara braunii]|uniref:Uncharacterized protein n=1 Tax=Chara braunii TaxID=69332 RepID=A0A388LIC9_CHABU|nr:hypothetical protein CBR_g34191 [Chara braunii]|eukprot:GBG82011.1 hypothetical protein CBR_g34191 [Chara braunii]
MAFRSFRSLSGQARRLLSIPIRRGPTWLEQSNGGNAHCTQLLSGHQSGHESGRFGDGCASSSSSLSSSSSTRHSLRATWQSQVTGPGNFCPGAFTAERFFSRWSAVRTHVSQSESGFDLSSTDFDPEVGTTSDPRPIDNLSGVGTTIGPSETVPGHIPGMNKRSKKFLGKPEAWIKVAPDQPCPPYQPNKGSVKNRKHKRRMALRALFAKNQAQEQIQGRKDAIVKRDAERKKRWKEGAQRAKAWAELVASRNAAAGGSAVLQ